MPTLHLFFTLWISLFSHSPKVEALWKEQTGRAMSSYSATRMWSHWEVQNQVLQQFGEVEPFLRQHEDISPATHTIILALLHNPQDLLALKVELAVVIDISSYFVKATHNLEGDGPLSIRCYGETLKIRCAINAKYYPNLTAICREACPGNRGLEQQLVEHGIKCVQPGLDYFQEKFGEDTKHSMAAFKAARVVSYTDSTNSS